MAQFTGICKTSEPQPSEIRSTCPQGSSEGVIRLKNSPIQIGNLILAAISVIGPAYAIAFSVLCAMHLILFNSTGHPIAFDFAEFWSAGELALSGNVLAAYDPRLIHAAEVATVGHPFTNFIGWFYPPWFFFVAAGLACLPPAWAFVLWINTTLLFCSATVAAIARRWDAALLAMAAPWAMLCTVEGQTGLLTAAIIGGVLLTLEHRPRLSGILLGLLTYKPHFGLLFPLVLVFSGYWRTFFWAFATAIMIALASGAAFGFGTFPAFVHALSGAAQVHLVTKPPSAWPALQSVYALARARHLPYGTSIVLQSILSATAMISVVYVWRTQIDYALKATALAAAVPLVTPYVWAYDMPLLSVTLAYFYRNKPFDRVEWWSIVLAAVAAASAIHYPGGLVANLIVAILAVRRIRMDLATPKTLMSRDDAGSRCNSVNLSAAASA